MHKIILFLTIIFLFACANNTIDSNCEDLTLNHHHAPFEALELPNWFLNMPQEPSLAIGIAPVNIYKPESTISNIKESASVISSRNKSAIVIAKLKMKESQAVSTPIISEFNLQLASDIPDLKRYFDNSKILATKDLCGMAIGLVGAKTADITIDESITKSVTPPLWYTEDVYGTEDNYLVSSGKSSSINMATAYKNAYQEAVKKLITGISPRVKSAIINSQNYTEKFVEIDASLIIENMINTRNSLVLRHIDNGYLYDAFVEIKWQADYTIKELKIKD